jgi:hypothetical protein
MNIDKSFLKLASQSLAESIDRTSMGHMARELVSDYSLEDSTIMPKGVDTPRIASATRIINDMTKYKLLIPFLNIFLSIHFNGYKGRKYKISRLRELLIHLYDMGFSLDTNTGRLYEDPKFRISRNWGVLREGFTYPFSFLWCDIASSSFHIEDNNDILINKFYEDYNYIVRSCVESRNGRVWHIEGDGILAAFHFGEYMEKSVYAAIDILNQMFLYNRFKNKLVSPIQLRLSCNKGTCEYSENHEDVKKSEQIAATIRAENYTEPDSISVSLNLSSSVGGVLQEILIPKRIEGVGEVAMYRIRWKS